LLAACDLAVGEDGLVLGFPEVRRGLAPALVSVILRDRIADRALRELFFCGELIDRDRALALGLITHAAASGRGEELALRLAGQILRGGPEAVRQSKAILAGPRVGGACEQPGMAGLAEARRSVGLRLEAMLEHHFAARRTAEAMEGARAFREKREPDWTGKVERKP
jgi:methylglutaconyl-CoA hydratase